MKPRTEIEIIKTKIDHLHQTVDEILQHVKLTNGRVRALEQWRNWLVGFAAGILALIPFPRLLDIIFV